MIDRPKGTHNLDAIKTISDIIGQISAVQLALKKQNESNKPKNNQSFEKIQEYLENSISCLNSLKSEYSDRIERIFDLVKESRIKKRRIFLIGNGGSASTASHFVCDLNKTAKIKGLNRSQAFALNDNAPLVFAISNDISYDSVFEEQLKNFLEKDDLVIAISGSGNSENIIKAVNYANENGAITIGLTGFDGGSSVVPPDLVTTENSVRAGSSPFSRALVSSGSTLSRT